MMLRERLEQLQISIERVKSSPRMKLYAALPGVGEAVRLIELSERLLAELVHEVEQMREVRKGVESGK